MIRMGTSGIKKEPTDDLMRAIREVESGSGRLKYGDWLKGADRSNTENARAHGDYQLHKEYVDDANRIGKTNYTYSDRLDEAKSKEMAINYLSYYGNRASANPTDEIFARIHNGGPRGYVNPNTVAYWNKVNKILTEQKSGTAAGSAVKAAPAPKTAVKLVKALAVKKPVIIQPAGTKPAAKADDGFKVFRKGDTLWGLWKNRADKSVTWPAFLESFKSSNPGIDINKIRPGMKYK